MVLTRSQRGVTFIELVMALSMSALVVALALALFKDVGLAARLAGGRRDDDRRALALFASLTENLQSGGGILHSGPARLRLLNLAGQEVDYAWEDSTLTVNGKPWPMSLASLRVDAWGPSLPPGEDWSRDRMEFAEVDSLDDDRDGIIDGGELDRDRSGEIEAHEARYIGRVEVTLRTARDGRVDSLMAVIHPRNRARGAAMDAIDALPGVGDFGR